MSDAPAGPAEAALRDGAEVDDALRAALLDELAALRRLADERWAAIARLAPAAKALRLRALELERALAAAEARLASPPGAGPDAGAARGDPSPDAG